MADLVWLSLDFVLLLHKDQLAIYGGQPGVRDYGLLESALLRPLYCCHYGDPVSSDICTFAAAYGYGLIRNHPFIDGNKRVGFMALELFLALNGRVLESSDEESLKTILDVATGEMSELELERWVRDHIVNAPSQ